MRLILSALAAVTLLFALPASARTERPDDRTPLTPQQIDHLEALTTLYRHARWFHPSVEVQHAPWDAVLIMTTRELLRAANDEEAGQVLRANFDPLLRKETWSDEPFAPLTDAEARDALDAPDLVRWVHRGVGEDQMVYFSQLRPAGEIGASDLVDLALLPGLHLRLPLVLRGRAEDPIEHNRNYKIPHSLPYSDRASRLAGVIELWATLESGFPYHADMATDWDATLRPALIDAATAEPGRDLMRVYLRMIEPLEDGHGAVRYRAPSQRAPLLLERIDGQVVVTGKSETLESIAIGDVIVAIDGVPVDQRIDKEMALISGSPQWKLDGALKTILDAPRETSLKVGLADGTQVDVPVGPAIEARRLVDAFRPEPVADLGDGILYFDIGRIEREDMEAAVTRLRSAKAVLFDMRGYPRAGNDYLAALATRPLQSADFIIPTITRPDWREMDFDTKNYAWKIDAEDDAIDVPMVMLIDGRSISYAESVAGLFKGEKLATLVGTPTAGANGNVTYIALPDNYYVYWTGMLVRNRDGSPHHIVGVQPDIEARPTLEGVRAGRDEVLDRGLAVLRQQMDL